MEFSKKGKVLLFAGAAIILIAASLIYFLVLNKDYERVFQEQSPEQLSKIATSLEEAGLTFNYPESGSGLLIEKNKLSQARIQLSKDNVFTTDIIGLEIFGEAQHAMSDFYQKINYQRAIQGELEKTLLTVEGVESARVHLAIPKEKSFSRKEIPVKAAVNLSIDDRVNVNIGVVVATVKQLVSSSVSELDPENVAVLDSAGKLLSFNGEGVAASNGAFGLKNEIEQSIERKVVQLLSPYFDRNDIGVSSWAAINNDKVSESTEGLDASEKPVVLKRITETISKTKKTPKSTVLNEEFSYKTVKRAVDYQKGRLQRLTVSVMVPQSEQLPHSVLVDLLSSALGIDAMRGDKLSVVLIPKSEMVIHGNGLVDQAIESETLHINVKSNIALNDPDNVNTVKDAEVGSDYKEKVVIMGIMTSSEYIRWAIVLLFILLVTSTQYYLYYRRNRSLTRQEEEMIVKDVQLWLEGKSFEQDNRL